jgi:hypothetical protein
MWEKYEVDDVKVEGDKATVLVNTTGIDMDDWKITDVEVGTNG